MYNVRMSNKIGRYQITEKDIDGVIRFLKTIAPEKATPEMAIALLEHFQAKFHMLAHEDPEKLIQILNELQVKSTKTPKN